MRLFVSSAARGFRNDVVASKQRTRGIPELFFGPNLSFGRQGRRGQQTSIFNDTTSGLRPQSNRCKKQGFEPKPSKTQPSKNPPSQNKSAEPRRRKSEVCNRSFGRSGQHRDVGAMLNLLKPFGFSERYSEVYAAAQILSKRSMLKKKSELFITPSAVMIVALRRLSARRASPHLAAAVVLPRGGAPPSIPRAPTGGGLRLSGRRPRCQLRWWRLRPWRCCGRSLRIC